MTRRLRRAPAAWLVGLGVALLMAALSHLKLPPASTLDRALRDRLVSAFASGEPARGTVVVDIDDVSLSAIGQWPWPRYRVANLVQRVAAAEPASIALDILFPDADRASLATVRDTFAHDFGVDLTFSGVPAGLTDNDAYLAREIGRLGVVGARYFFFDHVNVQPRALPTSLRFGGEAASLRADAATGVLENVANIAERTAVSGFVNSRLDDDGVLRQLPMLIRHQGSLHPSLGLAATMKALQVSQAEIIASRDGPILRVGAHDIPIDDAGYASLRFNGGPAAYPRVSALELINGRVAPETFAGKIVFIGTSAAGLRDHQVTAVDPRFPGTRIHAVLAENILRDTHLRTPSWAPWAVVAACLAVGGAMTAAFVGVGSIAFFGATSLALAIGVLATAVGMHHAGLTLPAGAPLLVIAVLFVAFLVLRAVVERRRTSRYRRQLAKSREITIESMAAVAETRDPETGAHIKRTQHYVRAIALELRRTGHYRDTLTPEYIDLLFLCAPLHDIGKVGVPDQILLKPGRLEGDEMHQMKQHAEYGRRIIAATTRHIEGDNFLTIAGEIAGTHHEKWDGTGYPLGLAGQAIPLSGRIMAVADIYDALISRRCYKEPFPHALAMSLLREGRDTTFDPVVLDAFFRIESEIKDIAARYQDQPDEAAGLDAPEPSASAGQIESRDASRGMEPA